MSNDYDIDNIFGDESTKPESNWFKFEKIGDKIAGLVVDIFEKEGNEQFSPQRVFTVKTKTGEEVNVGVKTDNEYMAQRVKNVRKGDLIGFEFVKEIPPKVKGYSPAKSIEPRIKYTKEGDLERQLEGIAPKATI
jgi:hypothetical protein